MKLNLIALLLILSAFSPYSFAFYTTGESAELIAPGKYHLGIEPQLRISDGSGFNVNGLIDTAFGKNGSIRGTLGFGNTDFFTSLAYKWVPIPDYDKQPALGGKLEVLYSRVGQTSLTGLKVHPLISKKFDTEYGLVVPYGSIPFTIFTTSAGSDTSLQLVGGAELSPEQTKKWKFSAELGVNMNKAFSYIAGTAIYLLDEGDLQSKKK